MVDGSFIEMRVVVRQLDEEQAWWVEVDPTSPLIELATAIIPKLPVDQTVNYTVSWEGTVAAVELVLIPEDRTRVGGVRAEKRPARG